MADFDVKTMAHGYQKRAQLALTTTTIQELASCALGTLVSVDALYVSNASAAEASISVTCYDASTTSNVDILTEGAVPGNCSLVVIDKDSPIYLEESDTLKVQAGTGNVLSTTASYRVMT